MFTLFANYFMFVWITVMKQIMNMLHSEDEVPRESKLAPHS